MSQIRGKDRQLGLGAGTAKAPSAVATASTQAEKARQIFSLTRNFSSSRNAGNQIDALKLAGHKRQKTWQLGFTDTSSKPASSPVAAGASVECSTGSEDTVA